MDNTQAAGSPVECQVVGDVLVISIVNPPINAGSLQVRQGLLDAIWALGAQPELVAGVIIGAGTTFMAGSDLKEFGLPLADPQLPEVIRAIEACAKPVVAAIHGAALGGGFELALGCDGRIAVADAQVGLPEVSLGMIPGAGGTQRVPRLVGIPRAIEFVCSGERLRAPAAQALGLIDRIAAGDLESDGVKLARELVGNKRRVAELSAPDADAGAVASAASKALRAGKSRPQVSAAIAAVKMAADVPIAEALGRERKVFEALRLQPEAAALRYQFFSERKSARLPELAGVSSRDVRSVCVIGAGTMGRGIAIAALDAGFAVTLLEQDDSALERGVDGIASHYNGRAAEGKMSAPAAGAALGRLTATVDWAALSSADLIIEAVFEELGVKRAVFKQIDEFARPGAVLATNTSYLDLDAIAEATCRPSDVVGLHFFSPANLMRLVEVVRGAKTALDVLATGVEVAKRMRKLPVVTRNAFGFIGNRIYAAYRRQCEFMLEEGAYPEQIDAALQAFGFAMGPFAVADMSGLDIAWRMRQARASSRDPMHRYVDIPDLLCERGRLGRKAGVGYYRYAPGQTRGEVDPEVHALIDEAVSRGQRVPRALASAEIQQRALMTMVNEALLLLSEGVATGASDVDLVLVNGYGFPRWEGGPLFWASRFSVTELEEKLAELAEQSGSGFVRADAAAIHRFIDVAGK